MFLKQNIKSINLINSTIDNVQAQDLSKKLKHKQIIIFNWKWFESINSKTVQQKVKNKKSLMFRSQILNRIMKILLKNTTSSLIKNLKNNDLV